MSLGKTPKVPAVIPPPNPATMADPSVAAASAKTQQVATGLPSTLMTSGQGVTGSASTSQKSLFGQ